MRLSTLASAALLAVPLGCSAPAATVAVPTPPPAATEPAPASARPALSPADADALARIWAEAHGGSQVMDHLHQITDVFGPRLTGSPALEASGEWVMATALGFGADRAYTHEWDWGHPGWTNEYASAHLTAPRQQPLVAEVLAWTPGTDGLVMADAVSLVAPTDPTAADLAAYFARMEGAVRGAAVMVGSADAPPSPFASAPPPARRDSAEVTDEFRPSNPATPRTYRDYLSRLERPEGVLNRREVNAKMDSFVVAAGAALRLDPSTMENGLIRAFSNRSYDAAQAVPTLVVRREDYAMMERLLADGLPVQVQAEIRNTFYPERTTERNYLAELAGSAMPDEVVMIGGHRNSWHAATGATDNGIGSAVMLEALRILKATGLPLKRTVRLALWTGEEQGLYGSRAYVADAFGTFEEPTAAYDGFVAYLNLDSGTGRVRGASAFGPEAAAEALDAYLAPLDTVGVAGARPTFSRGLGGSDHTAFSAVGLPGVSLGQDPIAYFTTTWHTNVDTYEQVLPDDARQAAAVAAYLAYRLANADETLARFADDEMPAAPPSRF